jgi:hypothetical protein
LSNLRAPGKMGTIFAAESFTDELASAAGIDAVAFRRQGLTDPRALAVIDRAAAMIGCGTVLSAFDYLPRVVRIDANACAMLIGSLLLLRAPSRPPESQELPHARPMSNLRIIANHFCPECGFPLIGQPSLFHPEHPVCDVCGADICRVFAARTI